MTAPAEEKKDASPKGAKGHVKGVPRHILHMKTKTMELYEPPSPKNSPHKLSRSKSGKSVASQRPVHGSPQSSRSPSPAPGRMSREKELQ